MENAVDALKIGFAVLVFAMALSLTMYMFSNARQTADLVLHSSDMSSYMEYIEPEEGSENRIVGLETIIPTLYKYYKENYTVIFRNASDSYLSLYETKTNTDLWSAGFTNRYYGGKNTKVCSFDVNEETRRHEPWTGSETENKRMLDIFIQGGNYTYTDSRGVQTINFGEGLYKYKNRKFTESLGEYVYNADNSEATDGNYDSGLIKNRKKRVIIYTLHN